VVNRALGPPGVFTPEQGGPGAPPGGGGGPGGGGEPGGGQPGRSDPDEGLGLDTQGAPAFGGPAGTITLVYTGGGTYTPSSDQYAIPADRRARAVARSGKGLYFTDMTVHRTHIRVLVQGIGSKGALMVALPLTDMDHTLHNQLLLLLGIAAAGVAVAALLGLLVARTALAPIARFTRQAEAIADAPERLDQRVRADGNDELSRLGRTFNTTLDALERSV
jgi:two-component system, OmpR family, sensor histidine kinase MprB